MKKVLVLLFAGLAVPAMLSAGDAAQRMERLKFAAGLTTAEISGRIKGDDGVAYIIGAKQGQTLKVAFAPENPRCYFNVVESDAEEKTLHDGKEGGNSFEGRLAASGDYLTQVYLVKEAAQHNEICDYSIKIEVTG